ncbi:PQQ-binding-like beta-propeller repeat protein [Gammaproteobacteria bacterium]|nr:PQQ-binding-like beta-propeller repeat protein [Gammaproteobacteria bacterium]
MSNSNEVYLGQKNSVARFNLDTQKSVWSKAVKGSPSIITTCDKNVLVQSSTIWGTYNHYLLDAETGNEIWVATGIGGWIVPQYHKGNIYFTNAKGAICKLCGVSGKLLFETKFKKWYDSTTFILTVAKDKIYVLSKKKSFHLEIDSGELVEVPKLANFTKDPLTFGLGNGVDQMALFSSITLAAAAAADAGPVIAG